MVTILGIIHVLVHSNEKPLQSHSSCPKWKLNQITFVYHSKLLLLPIATRHSSLPLVFIALEHNHTSPSNFLTSHTPPTKFNLFPMRTYSITLLICSLATTCITWWPPQPLNPPTIVHQQAHYKYGQIVNPTLHSHGCCLCTTIIRCIATSFHDRYYLLALIDQCNQWWMQSVVDNGKTLNQEPKQGLGFITNWYNTMNKQYQAKKKLKKRKYPDIDLFS